MIYTCTYIVCALYIRVYTCIYLYVHVYVWSVRVQELYVHDMYIIQIKRMHLLQNEIS